MLSNQTDLSTIAVPQPYTPPLLERFGDFRDHTLGSSPGSSGIGLQIFKEDPIPGLSVPAP